MNKGRGSIRLFQVFGITVWLNYSWFLALAYGFEVRKGVYQSPVWIFAEVIGMFCIVLLHEFGHSLACKQTGGQADEIVLWPLGGVAYVSPPNRPGAVLWSIAAGPLVNVMLVPILFGAWIIMDRLVPVESAPDLVHFLGRLAKINLVILVFNLLPIFPLDGGQILRSLLWFVIGPVKSLYAVVVIGFAGALGMGFLALKSGDFWFGLLALFAASRCWAGFKQAKLLGKIEAIPRHRGFKCPSCGELPFAGDFWTCNRCLKPFDAFACGARCPQCDQEFPTTTCPSCRVGNPLASWRVMPPPL
ncbi:MAG: M50 family metallopeptidase [Verrucomicrobiota bacterium]